MNNTIDLISIKITDTTLKNIDLEKTQDSVTTESGVTITAHISNRSITNYSAIDEQGKSIALFSLDIAPIGQPGISAAVKTCHVCYTTPSGKTECSETNCGTVVVLPAFTNG